MYQSECVYEDMQKLQIQERNEDTEPGFMPEKKELIVSGDLIDTVMPGDSVLVTGIYKLFGQC